MIKSKQSLYKLRNRALLLIPAFLFSSGLSLCLVFGQNLLASPIVVTYFSCLFTLIFCCIVYNRYTLLGTLLLSLLLWLLFSRGFFRGLGLDPNDWPYLVEYLRTDLSYVYGFLFLGAAYNPNLDWILILSIVVFSSLLSTILLFRLRLALVAALLGLFVFILEWSFQPDEVAFTIWPMAIACAALLPTRPLRRLPPAMWQTVSLAIVVSVLGASICGLFIPADTATLRSYRVERALDDVNDVLSDYTGYRRPHNSFSLAWIGYQPLGDRLGGAVTLSEFDVFRVNSTRARLLRGMVRNFYTGTNWTDTVDLRTYRLGNPMLANRQREIFGLNLPLGNDLETSFATDSEIQVTHLTPLRATIFTIGRVRDVLVPYDDVIVNFNDKGEVFSKRDLLSGTSYTVVSRLPNTESASFPSVMRTIYQNELTAPYDPEIAQENAYFFSGLYEGIPESIGKLAAALTENSQNDYEKAYAIQKYLMENFTYTLSPSDPPEDADFVEYFLQTGEGYCTYFASAMAVLARSAGLPSRYVEGFLLDGSRYEDRAYIVSADQAHAWAEIYLEGVGWLPFDATPRADRSTAPPIGPSNIDGNLEEEMPYDEPGEPIDIPEFISIESSNLWRYIIYAVLSLTVLIAAFIIPVRLHRRRWRDENLAARVCDPSERISLIWRDSIRLLSMLGCEMQIGETPYLYANRIDEMVVNPAGLLLDHAQTVVRARYGSIAPNDDELAAANRYRMELDLQYRQYAGRFRYLFTRALRSMVDRKK